MLFRRPFLCRVSELTPTPTRTPPPSSTFSSDTQSEKGPDFFSNVNKVESMERLSKNVCVLFSGLIPSMASALSFISFYASMGLLLFPFIVAMREQIISIYLSVD